MFRRIESWLLKRRFERLFVKPFAARIEAARKSHGRVRGVEAERRAFVHFALRGGA